MHCKEVRMGYCHSHHWPSYFKVMAPVLRLPESKCINYHLLIFIPSGSYFSSPNPFGHYILMHIHEPKQRACTQSIHFEPPKVGNVRNRQIDRPGISSSKAKRTMQVLLQCTAKVQAQEQDKRSQTARGEMKNSVSSVN